MSAADGQEAIDLVFDLQGEQLPAEHRLELWQALQDALPWLEDEPDAGIHPLRTARTTYGVALLPRRAKLVLRLPVQRLEAARVLEGRVLDVAGSRLAVGASHGRSLPQANTLYADFVTTGSDEEAAFTADVAASLARLGAACRLICGRTRRLNAGTREIAGFALVLHEVPAERSRLLQQRGLGGERKLGCGILVQHKAIAGID